MAEFRGRLTVGTHGNTGEPTLRVHLEGERKPYNVDLKSLDEGLLERWEQDRASLENVTVTVELSTNANGRPKGGKARFVRPEGAPRPVSTRAEQPEAAAASTPDAQPRAAARDFVNPYTFVPAPPREAAAGTELGDRTPWGHHRRHPDGWSGRIRIQLTTVTPLLIPDAANTRVTPNDHQIQPLRVGPDGKPYLPPTSVKGMLRAAYEAVTNSRFGVFGDHSRRLGYRAGKHRAQFATAPRDLLDCRHRPATSLDQLSPADRVFGWVNPNGHGAYRGALRVGPVTCTTDDPVEHFDGDGVPLAILSGPKPTQARFYAAKDPDGTPVGKGVDKAKLYTRDAGLRGRKVYVHHAGLPPGYWDNPTEDRTQRGPGPWHQEYRRPNDAKGNPQRDNQNRSVTAWVRPGVTFATTLHVENLSDLELGALLWLLDLPEGAHHRLGGGKPLGFGSVRVEIDRSGTSLAKGATVAAAWRELTDPAEDDWSELAEAFQEKVEEVFPARNVDGGRLGILDAFLQAATGPVDKGVAVHYPRSSERPDPEGKQYEWFTANERQSRDQGRPGHPLPLPGQALPFLDSSERPAGDRRGGGGRGGGGRGQRGPGGGPPGNRRRR
ncbi:MAG: TIGR03986 family CRISPR-associated RAMP protein [Acidimicrobiales bacterium]